MNKLIKCEKCQIEILLNQYKYHIRTNLHKSNCLLRTEFQNINIIATAFKNRIVTYRLNPSEDHICLTSEDFFNENQKDLTQLIMKCINKHNCIKINFELFAYFLLPKTNETQLKSFVTKYQIINHSTDFNELFLNLSHIFKTKLAEFEQCESGWSYLSMSHLEINVNKYCPLRGGMFIDLPKSIKHTKSCVNIKNNDNCCFLWCIVAALYPTKNNVCRTKSYPHYNTVLNTKGMSFPPSFTDIKIFEKNNDDISVNVYGLDKQCSVTGPLYLTTNRKKNHINLLYIEHGNRGHYCLIKNLVRLVHRQVTRHKGKLFLCEACLQFFNNESKYLSHQCNHIISILPEKNSVLKFKNYERQLRINFIIYADFECLLLNSNEQNCENTESLKLHQPSCFGYYICCSHNSSLNKYVAYRGSDCVTVFIKSLIKDAKRIRTILSNKVPMLPLTLEQELKFQKSTICHICNEVLFDDKVRDHDHITSEYRGAAHSHCNLMHRVCPFIPIVFHNLSGYDSHLFIKELMKYEGAIKVIPQTKEKYLSFTKIIDVTECTHPIQLKFIDSFQFLSSSLDMLSKSLSENDFTHLSNEFSSKEQFDLLHKKGIYPYDYMDSWSKFEETELPPKHSFYNRLTNEHIQDSDYKHALKVWNSFNIQTLGEYTDLYLKSDVLLLCDIFEKFRLTSLIYYKLDPAYYITSPSLSWDAMLFYTKVQLELINDIEMYQMLERGIRGGLAQCSLRHAKASNKYLPNYNKSKKSSYLIYLDCNNLYGYAMTKKYPISDFKFLSSREIMYFNVMNISDESDFGYILEVDLLYPDHLHDLHHDLPFAAEKFVPPGGKSAKLIASLYDKFNYVIHYVHLKECVKHGLVLTKIHRILSFRQENYLKKYIDLNTTLRQLSKTTFEKDFFKLLNNSIFGKTIENKRKQVDVKLVTRWSDNNNVTNKHLTAEKLITRPNFNSVSIFSKNFVAIQLNKEKIILDRPIYIGFTVLEYSKQHMYNFHYDFIKNMYQGNAKLCYTDTDSLLYLIFTDDFYKDMLTNISKFDTSNFMLNNIYNIPRKNEKIPGLFKDELGGAIITEFVGLRAKLYCIKSEKSCIKKAKGITKAVTKHLTLSDYNKNLFDDSDEVRRKITLIRSIKHVLYTQRVNKRVFSSNDDKRQIQSDRIHTLPWGHCKTIY